MNDTDIKKAKNALLKIVRMMQRPGDGVAATYRRVATELSKRVTPNATWTYQYILQIATGSQEPSPRVIHAIYELCAKLNLSKPKLPKYRRVSVLAPAGLVEPGTVILAASKTCALDGCFRRFISPHPSQQYCSVECRKKARKARIRHLD